MYKFGRIYCGEGISNTIHLREACHDAKSLTPDFTKLSGFKEIDDIPFSHCIINEKMKVGKNLQEIAYDLIYLLKKILLENWDSNNKHCFGLSAGRNCRIILMCLRDLQKEGLDLGEYELRAHQHEHIYARDICKELGFPLDRLKIWREDTVDKPDHYRFAELDCHPNACFGPHIQWFESDYDYDNNVFVSCGIAGALFFYPFSNNWGTLSMEILEKNFRRVDYSEMFYLDKWDACLFNPFMDETLLGYICSVPDKYHQQADVIRTEMIRQLGYSLVPLVYGHKINYQFSGNTRGRIRDFYLSSQYYKDFKINVQPWNYVGLISERNNHDMRALGLALMYEGVER